MRTSLCLLLLMASACKPEPQTGPGASCPVGTLGCPCFAVGACYDGLPCAAGECVQPGDVNLGDPAGGDASTGDPTPADASAGDATGADGPPGDGVVGDPGGDNGAALGPPSPITVGETAWYFFAHSFRRDTGACSLDCGEKQSSGSLCLEVGAVDDTETAAHQNAPETVIHAEVAIVGGNGIPEIVISDQDATGAPDPVVVDAAIAPLWLKRLLVPSRDHGFTTPAPVSFHTREPPTPPGQSLSVLPFFDPRQSHDWAWGGWSWINEDCSLHLTESTCPWTCRWDASGGCTNRTLNHVNALLRYFIDEYGVGYFTDNRYFRFSHSDARDCASYPDTGTCQAADCHWDFAANGGAGACIVAYSIHVRWRHALATGPLELQGPVLHALRLTYDDIGLLASAQEFIAPDPSPTAPLASDLANFVSCISPEPCASAMVELNRAAWADAYCTF